MAGGKLGEDWGGVVLNWLDPIEDAEWFDKHNGADTLRGSQSAHLIAQGRGDMKGMFDSNKGIY